MDVLQCSEGSVSCKHIAKAFERMDFDPEGIIQYFLCADCKQAWTEYATGFEAIEREAIERSLEVTRKRRELGLAVRT